MCGDKIQIGVWVKKVLFVDDFVTYYENEVDVPADALEARDFTEN